VTRLPALQAAHQKLVNLGIRTLGAVVIGTKDAAAPYQTALVPTTAMTAAK
jgi:hypothetical protein